MFEGIRGASQVQFLAFWLTAAVVAPICEETLLPRLRLLGAARPLRPAGRLPGQRAAVLGHPLQPAGARPDPGDGARPGLPVRPLRLGRARDRRPRPQQRGRLNAPLRWSAGLGAVYSAGGSRELDRADQGARLAGRPGRAADQARQVGAEPQGALPVPLREDAVVLRLPRERELPLLRLRQARRRLHLGDGDRARRLRRGAADAGRARRRPARAPLAGRLGRGHPAGAHARDQRRGRALLPVAPARPGRRAGAALPRRARPRAADDRVVPARLGAGELGRAAAGT